MENLKKKKQEYRAKILYEGYYIPHQDTIKKMLDFYKGKTIAIWGGGFQGTAFLKLFDKNSEYIRYVIDIKKAKHGQIIAGREIISCYNLAERKIDIIILLNQRHFVQNYNIIQEQNLSCIVHDMDEIVKNRLTLTQIKNHEDLKNNPEENRKITEMIQEGLLPLLKETKRICEKNNIPYFLCAGTALGAVRHKGFIPWDDDLDVGMFREDYERFLKIADRELSSGYLLMDAERTPDYYVNHAKIFRDHTALVDQRTSHLKIHHGFYLDIFPFDTIPEQPKMQDVFWQESENTKHLYTQMKKKENYSGKNPFHKFMANEEIYWLRLKYGKRLEKKVHSVMTKYNDTNSIYVADLCAPYNKKLFFKRDDIYPFATMEFEGNKYPVPGNYDRYLEIMYGDYMTFPPEEKRYVKHNIIELSLEHNFEADRKWLKKYYRKYVSGRG